MENKGVEFLNRYELMIDGSLLTIDESDFDEIEKEIFSLNLRSVKKGLIGNSDIKKVIRDTFEDLNSKLKSKSLDEVKSTYRRVQYKQTKDRWVSQSIRRFEEYMLNPSEYSGKKTELIGVHVGVTSDAIIRSLELISEDDEKAGEMLVEKVISKISLWAQSESTYISNYPFIEEKTSLQQLRAFEFDVQAIILRKIDEKASLISTIFPNQEDMENVAKSYFSIPFDTFLPFSSNAQSFVLLKSEISTVQELETYRSVYKTGENSEMVIRFTFDKKLEDELLIPKTAKGNDGADYYRALMPVNDFELIEALLKTNKNTPLLDTETENSISDLAELLYDSRAPYYHQAVLKRLIQLRGMNISKYEYKNVDDASGQKRELVLYKEYSFIDNLSYRKIGLTGEKRVYVTLSQKMVSAYVKSKAFQIGKDDLSSYPRNMHEIVFYMQYLRYKHYQLFRENMADSFFEEKQNEEFLITIKTIFSDVGFEAKKKGKKESLLIETISKLQEEKNIIESFKYIRGVLYIKFTQVTDDEKKTTQKRRKEIDTNEPDKQ